MQGVCIRDFWDGPNARYYEKGMVCDVEPESQFARFFRFDQEKPLPKVGEPTQQETAPRGMKGRNR